MIGTILILWGAALATLLTFFKARGRSDCRECAEDLGSFSDLYLCVGCKAEADLKELDG